MFFSGALQSFGVRNPNPHTGAEVGNDGQMMKPTIHLAVLIDDDGAIVRQFNVVKPYGEIRLPTVENSTSRHPSTKSGAPMVKESWHLVAISPPRVRPAEPTLISLLYRREG